MAKPDHLLVVGTRPEVIKTAPLVRAFVQRGVRHRLTVMLSGQQSDLIDHTGSELSVDVRLPDWPPERSRAQRGAVIDRLVQVFRVQLPSRVIVQGDTTTTYCAAIAAARCGLELHHVEAGLRSGHLRDPFPEELHRRAIGRSAAMHYAPTEIARANLLREGVPAARILLTGNTGIDQLELLRPLITTGMVRDRVLITLHRQENHGGNVGALMTVLLGIARRHPMLELIWVAHPNPGIAEPLRSFGAAPAENLLVVPPCTHRALIAGSDRYALIMTDSGGLQEEATHLGIPLIVLRRHTERPEALATDRAICCAPSDAPALQVAFDALIGKARRPRAVFGTGDAAERILGHLLSTAPGAFPSSTHQAPGLRNASHPWAWRSC